MKKSLALFGATLLSLSINAQASDMGTVEEAKAMSESAAALVNNQGEAAFETFSAEGDYKNKDLYVFCMDMEGKILSHAVKPDLVGKNLINFDKYGDKLFVNMIEVASSEAGQGWVDYKWPYPGTEELKSKKSYVIKNEKGFFCGVGAYAN